MMMMTIMWHPMGSQVAYKVVFRPVAIWQYVKCLGTLYCLKKSVNPVRPDANTHNACPPGLKCMVVTAVPLNPSSSPVQCRHFCLRPTRHPPHAKLFCQLSQFQEGF